MYHNDTNNNESLQEGGGGRREVKGMGEKKKVRLTVQQNQNRYPYLTAIALLAWSEWTLMFSGNPTKRNRWRFNELQPVCRKTSRTYMQSKFTVFIQIWLLL